MTGRNISNLMRPFRLPDSVSSPVVTPLSPSVVYASRSPDELDAQYDGDLSGYTYAREGHPNADVLANLLDRMESAQGGFVTGSGMAAVSAVLMGLMGQGDHVLGGDQLYGRSLRMLQQDLPRLGVTTSFADAGSVEAMRAALRPETKLILIEVVSNPTLRVADLHGLVALAKERGILLAVDNTFTTPRAVQPLLAGADIVIHSVTKLLAGHSDATLGYVAAKSPEVRQQMFDFAVTAGLTASPFDCWLAERGLLTFDLRFERAQQNAQALAETLGDLPGVKQVLYPKRTDHPDHDLAYTVLGANGGNMVSFELEGGRAAANSFVQAASELAFAPTLGDVGTTLSHPASSSHRALSEQSRLALGITEGFFRISVGLESIETLRSVFSDAVLATDQQR